MPNLQVAVFQAEWPLQKQTTNLVQMFCSAGYDVDVFLYHASERFETFGHVEQETGLRIFRFDQEAVTATEARDSRQQRRLPKRLSRWQLDPLCVFATRSKSKARAFGRRIRDWLAYTARIGAVERLLPKNVLAASVAHMDGRTYASLFGVEKLGLVWAGIVAQRYHTRLVYFSLELYTKDFPGLNDPRSQYLKRLECHYHQLSDATIVQDSPRAHVLFSDTGAEPRKVFYIPVSILGPPILAKPRILRGRLNVADGVTVVLSFGNMFGVRFVRELVLAAQTFPADWLLVMHGPWPGATMRDELQELDRNKRVVISTELLPPAQVDEFVASADIGLALYPDRTQNEYLTGKSSEKAALYAKAGVPLIAFDYPRFRNVFDEFGSGVAIKEMEQLSSGIRTILDNYQAYRQGAFRAYRGLYEFSQHFGEVKRWLEVVPDSRQAAPLPAGPPPALDTTKPDN
jgi:glycosyltransferase involved in cell wall biosynthesis